MKLVDKVFDMMSGLESEEELAVFTFLTSEKVASMFRGLREGGFTDAEIPGALFDDHRAAIDAARARWGELIHDQRCRENQ
jgi:hypothetical protein